MVVPALRIALGLLATALLVGGLVGAHEAREELGDEGLSALIGPASGAYGARQRVLALNVAACRARFMSALDALPIAASLEILDTCDDPIRSYLATHPMDASAWLLLAILSQDRRGTDPEAVSQIEAAYATGRNDSRGLVARIVLSLKLDEALAPELRGARASDLDRASAARLDLKPIYALAKRDARAYEALKLSIRLMRREEQDFVMAGLAGFAATRDEK